MNIKLCRIVLFLGFIHSVCLGADPFEEIKINLTEVVAFLEEKMDVKEGGWAAESLEGSLIFDSWNKKEEKFLFVKGHWSIVVSRSNVECILIDKFNYLWKYELSQTNEGLVLLDSAYLNLDEGDSEK